MTTTFEKCLNDIRRSDAIKSGDGDAVSYIAWLMIAMRENNRGCGAERWKLVSYNGDSMDVLDCLHNKVVRFAVTVG